MKKLITMLFLIVGVVVYGQSNLTIFNNGGQQFYVILNGVKQNSIPMTNVVVGGIKNGSYSVKLIFSDGKTPDIDKNFMIDTPSDITTRVIFKKGKGKLQLIGMEPTKGSVNQEGVIVYRPDNSAVFSDAVVTQQTVTTTQTTTTPTSSTVQQTGQSVNQSGTTNVSTTQTNQGMTQTTTITDPNNPNGNVGMNVSINIQDPTMNNGAGNINMNVNMSGTGQPTQTSSQSSQSTQTTTVTTTQTTSTSQTVNGNTGQSISQTGTTSTNSPSGQCKNLLGDGDKFVVELNAISFDEDRKNKILNDLKSYCLTTSQAYKIIETLTFEEDRLLIAKYLYDRMIDKNNAGTLMQLFNFDSTRIEFREYMNSKK